jgi:hypothetical protein
MSFPQVSTTTKSEGEKRYIKMIKAGQTEDHIYTSAFLLNMLDEERESHEDVSEGNCRYCTSTRSGYQDPG